MSDQLPILDELEAAATFSAIAEWLTRCPLAVFASHGHEIEAIVKARGFGTAGTYVAEYQAAVHRTRNGRFQAYYSGIQFDANGTCSEDLLRQAADLDRAARYVGRIDLSWHEVHNAG